jgi:hypothetical protein
MFFDDPLRQCQPKANTIHALRARRLRAKKSVKHVRERIGRNSHSGILHSQHSIAVL